MQSGVNRAKDRELKLLNPVSEWRESVKAVERDLPRPWDVARDLLKVRSRTNLPVEKAGLPLSWDSVVE